MISLTYEKTKNVTITYKLARPDIFRGSFQDGKRESNKN